MVHLECDLYVPDTVRMLASGGLADALHQIDQIRPMAESLGLPMEGVPSTNEARAMSGFVDSLKADTVVVGEDDESQLKIASKLRSAYLRDDDLDTSARIVGKVKRRWNTGEWKSLIALPGASLVPRAERRKMERKQPGPDDLDQYLEGPALMLEMLAIYQ